MSTPSISSSNEEQKRCVEVDSGDSWIGGVIVSNQPCEKYFSVHRHFPKPGVVFRSMAPLLQESVVMKNTCSLMLLDLNKVCEKIDCMLLLDSRGYLSGSACQMVQSYMPGESVHSDHTYLKTGMVTKAGKTPGNKILIQSTKEYGSDILELSESLCVPGQSYAIKDDLLATGGTVLAVAKALLERKAKVAAFLFLGILPPSECKGVEAIRTYQDKKTGEYPFRHTPIITGCIFNPVTDPDPSLTRYLTTLQSMKGKGITSLKGVSMDKPIVIAHPSMYSWARQLSAVHEFPFLELRWSMFSNASQDIDLTDMVDDFEDRKFIYLMSTEEQKDLISQWMVLRVMGRQRIKALEVWVPYFHTSTHERRNKRKVVAAAEPMWKMFSVKVPPTKTGPPLMVNVDIHAEQEEFYGSDDMGYQFLDGLPRFLNLLDLNVNPQFPTKRCFAVFPDAGAYKRFINAVTHFNLPVMTFHKDRDGDSRKVRFLERINWPKDAEGKELDLEHAIVIDDLALSGGTLIEVSAALKKMGVRHVDCYVTHASFPNQAWEKFLGSIDIRPFRRVYTTDSIPNTEVAVLCRSGDDNPFYFIPLSPLIVHARRTRGRIVSQHKEDIYTEPPVRDIRVMVTSSNASKLEGIAQAFAYVYPYDNIHIHKIPTSSRVPNQPFDEQTMQGAKNRADYVINIYAHKPDMTSMFKNPSSKEGELNLESSESKKELDRVWAGTREHYLCTYAKNGTEFQGPRTKGCSHIGPLQPIQYHKTFIVSVEDGLFSLSETKTLTSYRNKGAVVIYEVMNNYKENTRSWSGYTMSVQMPNKYVHLNGLITAGELYFKDKHPDESTSVNGDEWFLHEGTLTRAQLIKETVVKGLFQLQTSYL